MIEPLPKSNPHWYAIYTRPRFEKKLNQQLTEQDYITYLPLVTTLKQWSDRKKKVQTPLIPSYIFIKANEADLKESLRFHGVISVLKHLGKPAIVQDYEIENLKILLNAPEKILTTENKNLKKGEIVMVENGVLKGLIAECVKAKGKYRIIVRIIALSNIIEVNIPLSYVSKITNPSANFN
tara:strand:+ start:529321 stop:529863 length:543 start_codon:yes stop_codon:yes gene_type:complete